MRGFAGAVVGLAAAASATPLSIETIHDGAAPLISSTNAEAIPNSYIIKFKKHVSDAGALEHQTWVQQIHLSSQVERLELRKRGQEPLVDDVFHGVRHTYKVGNEFLGYAGNFDEATIEKVRWHPDVEFIEVDSVVHTQVPIQSQPEDTCDNELQKLAPWGLARVSHRQSLGFGTYDKYLYAENAGEGVDAYVIDTGTNVDHVDFEGRAKWGKTIPSGDQDIDGNGHGTHCSGTIAGKKYGVAKKANVYAVKVLRSNGSGTMSDVVKGVEWAAISHAEQVKAAKDGKRKGFKGSVANMSLGGGKTQALDAVVNAAVDAGIHFAVAAGNDNSDACNYSPAAATKAVTVGATELGDRRSYFSNYGKCTDIFAPGTNIKSTWIGSKYAVNTISGTSMASPHICGLLAYYLSLQPAADSEYSVAPIAPVKLKKTLISVGTLDAISDMPGGTPNVLAWNGGGCNNFSSIVEAGSFTVKKESQDVIVDLRKVSEVDVTIISGKLPTHTKDVKSKAKHLVSKIRKLVDEELKNFLKETAL